MASDTTQEISPNIDDFLRYGSKIGSLKQAITNNLYGINFSGVPGGIPFNEENVGLIFFVRPQLNLSSANVRNNRKIYPLLTTNAASMQAFVRATLDPRLALGIIEEPILTQDLTNDSPKGAGNTSKAFTPLVDPENPFIPVLTNTVVSASGWPDIVQPTYTSENGVRKEQYSQADGVIDIFESYDVDVTFRNQVADPIIYMFYVWLVYQSSVVEGTMTPYLDFLKENELDYNTRIYRLVLDKSRRFVSKVFATGVSFPLTVPTSQFFDFNYNGDYYNAVKEFTIRFRCIGANFNDDILIDEFNRTVGIFNPGMRKLNNEIDKAILSAMGGSSEEAQLEAAKASGLTKVPYELRDAANFRMYPRINTETYELEWYAKTELVNTIKRIYGVS